MLCLAKGFDHYNLSYHFTMMTVHYTIIRPFKEAAMKRGMLAVWEDAHQLCELMS